MVLVEGAVLLLLLVVVVVAVVQLMLGFDCCSTPLPRFSRETCKLCVFQFTLLLAVNSPHLD